MVGGGPAGLAAAREAVRSGARVILIDDQPELGGSLLSGSTDPALAETIEGVPALDWVSNVEAELISAAECTVLNRTSAFGSYDSNYVIAAQNRTDHLLTPAAPGVSRQRIWHIRAAQVILAPGAHERPLVFENNDRPGIMLASAVRSYLNRYAVAPGSRVVISTTNDSAYALAADLRAAGVSVEAVVDARPQLSEAAAAVAAGTRVLIGSAVANTTGEERLSGVTVRSINDDGELTSGVEELACDLLAVSGGWSPWCTCTPSARARSAGMMTWRRSCPAASSPTSRWPVRAGAALTSTTVSPKASPPGQRRPAPPASAPKTPARPPIRWSFRTEGVRPDPPALAGPRTGRRPG